MELPCVTQGLLPSERGGYSKFFDFFDIRPLRGGAARPAPCGAGFNSELLLRARCDFFFSRARSELGFLAQHTSTHVHVCVEIDVAVTGLVARTPDVVQPPEEAHEVRVNAPVARGPAHR